jgi:hypothetical protein
MTSAREPGVVAALLGLGRECAWPVVRQKPPSASTAPEYFTDSRLERLRDVKTMRNVQGGS